MQDKINFSEIMKKAMESDNNGELSSEKGVNDFIDKNLDEKNARKIKDVLSDENKMKTILNSSMAKELFKKLSGGNINGGF